MPTMPRLWDMWKHGFGAWERATTHFVEKALSNASVIGPAGALLTTVMKTKAASDQAMIRMWSIVGLPNRRDQELTLHKLNQLESRLFDLEEQLHAAKVR
ncbi:hypothetical protein BH11MYX1_BH11MYX1_11400 [soil metagenome]